MKTKVVLTGLGILAAAVILGFVLPRFTRTRLDAAEIRCSQNLKSIANSAKRFLTDTQRLPQSIVDLESYGLSPANTNCPAAPPNYLFDPNSTDLVVCPNHRIRSDGTAFRVTSNLVAHTSANP